MTDTTRTDGRTYLLVDGENIDATLGMSILHDRPAPDERPRWERLIDYLEDHWQADVTPLFFIAVHGGNLPMSFVQALMAIGYTPVPLTGPSDVKVVDVAINRTLAAIVERGGDVVLASHDGDFAPHMRTLVDDGRRVGVIGFTEFMSGELTELRGGGLEVLDLEDDAGVFNYRLPRMRVITIEDFDPLQFL